MSNHTAYGLALTLAIATAVFLFFLAGAVGIIGVEGDPADLMYAGVLAVGFLGALIARFRPLGMSRALFACVVATAVVAVVALAMGKHTAAYSSVFEILGLNAMFMVMFLASGLLFRRAAAEPREARLKN